MKIKTVSLERWVGVSHLQKKSIKNRVISNVKLYRQSGHEEVFRKQILYKKLLHIAQRAKIATA